MPPCRQAAAISRALDAQLAQGFPASDPPSLTQPSGDVSDAAGWGCSIEAEQGSGPARSAHLHSCCCGGGGAGS